MTNEKLEIRNEKDNKIRNEKLEIRNGKLKKESHPSFER